MPLRTGAGERTGVPLCHRQPLPPTSCASSPVTQLPVSGMTPKGRDAAAAATARGPSRAMASWQRPLSSAGTTVMCAGRQSCGSRGMTSVSRMTSVISSLRLNCTLRLQG